MIAEMICRLRGHHFYELFEPPCDSVLKCERCGKQVFTRNGVSAKDTICTDVVLIRITPPPTPPRKRDPTITTTERDRVMKRYNGLPLDRAAIHWWLYGEERSTPGT